MPKEGNLAYSLFITEGMQITLEINVDHYAGRGCFPRIGEVSLNGKKRQLINGYISEYENVGKIIEDGHFAIYQHLDSKENRVYFYADNGTVQIINITSMPVHDHSSILQGGPAFGTYASDYEEEES